MNRFVTLTSFVSVAAAALCGDGLCQAPEFSDSCPVDCGELLRNPELFGKSNVAPFFWKHVDGPTVTYVHETNSTSSVIRLPSGSAISQSALTLVPNQVYVFSVDADAPSCVDAYVHSSTEVFATGAYSDFKAGLSGEAFVSLRSKCDVSINSISLKPVPDATDASFRYGAIHETIIGKPIGGVSHIECKQMCLANSMCCAWETCPGTEAEGCGGCYLLARAPESSSVEIKKGWFASLERSVPDINSPSNPESCRKFLLDQSAHEENFYEKKLQKYNDCGNVLRNDGFVPKQIFVGGAHYPTIIVANHRTPEPKARTQGDDSAIIPHFFALPFYDTNIGNVIKSTGAMNVIQSYEMQSLVKPGDVFIDVGANLGSYTIPLAEAVGPNGMVIAFEPFRWLYQLMNANVALNGLMNVWSFQVALSDEPARKSLLQPNLRFYSSPGGVRVSEQITGMSAETQKQMYDHEWGLESVDSWPLDDILLGDDFFADKNRVPKVTLIKIDVEGMEANVIRGARKVIETFRPIIWSENIDFFEKGDRSFIELLESIDYACDKADNAPNDLICKDKFGRFNLTPL